MESESRSLDASLGLVRSCRESLESARRSLERAPLPLAPMARSDASRRRRLLLAQADSALSTLARAESDALERQRLLLGSLSSAYDGMSRERERELGSLDAASDALGRASR